MYPAIWIVNWIVLGALNMHNAYRAAKKAHHVQFFNSTFWYVWSLVNVAMCGYFLGIEVVNLWLA